VLVQLGGQPGQGGDRLEPAQVAVEVVVADGDVGQAVALGGLDLAEEQVQVVARGDARADVSEDDTDLQADS